MPQLHNLPKTGLKGLIHLYRYAISPLLGGSCRFHPTCSAYALDALEQHGAAKGSLLAVRRILKCHPWHKGPMIDPVPVNIDWRAFIGYKRAKPQGQTECRCSHHDKKEN